MDLKPLITLVAIINPLAIVPFFIHYTAGFDAEQQALLVRLSRIVFPAQVFHLVGGLLSAALLSRDRHARRPRAVCHQRLRSPAHSDR